MAFLVTVRAPERPPHSTRRFESLVSSFIRVDPAAEDYIALRQARRGGVGSWHARSASCCVCFDESHLRISVL